MGSPARRRLREIADPFVVAAPAGARVRTRLHLGDGDEMVLRAIGAHLGSLAGADLARRCRERRLNTQQRSRSRQERKQELTAGSSSRWAGAITRTSADSWQLAYRNLQAEARTLRARVSRIRSRLLVPVGKRQGRARGYWTLGERFSKQQRLQALAARLLEVELRLEEGRVSVCRGGRPLARLRHRLEEASLTKRSWRERWAAERLFLIADGEADKAWGNETIRWHPSEGWLEIKLPMPLAHLANRPHGRYRLGGSVTFSYRSDELSAQAASGAIRYDISFDPGRGRWHLDASWKKPALPAISLAELRACPVLAVDLNAGHLAVAAVDPSGNPVKAPVTIPLELAGLPASTRDGRLRAAVSELIHLAGVHQARAIVIEDLDFAKARAEGRERTGNRPSRGRSGRSFRRLVAGIPTAKLRDRLVQMASNRGLAVVAVDPAYTSRWGAEHWLSALRQSSSDASGHHAAALVIGRRGLGHPARRRGWCDSTSPEDGEERAAYSAGRPMPASAGVSEPHSRKPGTRNARGQPHPWPKTRPADRTILGNQAAQDRSGPLVIVSLGSR